MVVYRFSAWIFSRLYVVEHAYLRHLQSLDHIDLYKVFTWMRVLISTLRILQLDHEFSTRRRCRIKILLLDTDIVHNRSREACVNRSYYILHLFGAVSLSREDAFL